MGERTRVLYIASFPRSGSTLLGQMLDELPGVISVGEFVASLWTYGVRDNLACGCNVPFRECPFWSKVIRHAFGSFDELARLERALAPQKLARFHNIPLFMTKFHSRTFDESLRAYRDVLRTLYQSIRAVSGAEIIVDSSKSPTYAALLSGISDLRFQMIHLVRDSRAVTYSQQNVKLRPEIKHDTVPLEQMGVLQTAFEWNIHNSVIDIIAKRLSEATPRIRYKTLVRVPTQTLEMLCHELDLPLDLGFIKEQSVMLTPNHQLWGNPVRFAHGSVKLAEDTRWQSGMRKHHRWFVTLMTAPFLWRYRAFNDGKTTSCDTHKSQLSGTIVPGQAESTRPKGKA